MMPQHPRNRLLIAAGALSALAALVHLGCIVFGAPWYRTLGAGEQMVQMALRGSWYPPLITLFIAGVLMTWALFAWSGAGLIGRLPLLRTVLCLVTAVYLVRGVIVLPVIDHFPSRTPTFWWWSSAICLVIGIVHLTGLRQAWPQLNPSVSRPAC